MPRLPIVRLIGPATLMAVYSVFAPEAAAQTQSLFGNRGTFGQSGNQFGSSAIGASAFGRSSATSSGGRQMGTGLGGGAGLRLPVTAPGTFASQGSAFQSGFFAQQQGAAAFFGQLQRLGRQSGNFGQSRRVRRTGRDLNAFRNTADRRSENARFGNQPGSRRTFRPRHRVAFTHSKPATSEVVTTVRTRLAGLAVRRLTVENLIVELDEEGLLTLTGEVDSVETKKLAAAVARLEPGVRNVRNELAVRQASPSN